MKKSIMGTIIVLFSFSIGFITVGKQALKVIKKTSNMSDKHLRMFLLMHQWLRVRQDGKFLKDYFKEKGWFRIAVYGMSHMGESLVHELRNTDISVEYGIDRNPDESYTDIKVFLPDDEMPKVDVIVVTAVAFFDEIKNMLQKKNNDQMIVSLEDILYEM